MSDPIKYCSTIPEVLELPFKIMQTHVKQHRKKVSDCDLRAKSPMIAYYLEKIIPNERNIEEMKIDEPLPEDRKIRSGLSISPIHRIGTESLYNTYRRNSPVFFENDEIEDIKDIKEIKDSDDNSITMNDIYQFMCDIEDERRRERNHILTKLSATLDELKLL